ncbi:hypothetical protein GIY11_10430 [Aerococcaceae bacterium DSM 109653]|uniref:Peptidase M56 domain-containing protein n=1 Tax=Fundicoccus ignavus TaxID=2664442 RepID=A0A844BKD2_9LACT|nr:hypothetical protein [Fundicoccus ignavus]
MNLSFKTIFISIILSTPFILLQHYLMKKISNKSMISARILNLISLLFIFRMLLPVEYTYTISIYSKVIFPFVRDILIADLPLINTSLMMLFCILWGSVSFVKLIKQIRSLINFKKIVNYSYSVNFFNKTLPENYQKLKVRVLSEIKSPCVIGFIKPIILLPNTFFTETELTNILKHEYLHISRFDLIVKGIYEFLVIIYWWNPLMYIFREQFSTIIELRVDEELVENFSTEERIEYIQLMLKVQNEQNYSTKASDFALYFNAVSEEPLYQRSVNILNNNKFKPKLSTLVVLFLIGFYFSTSIIIEPYYENSTKRDESFLITKDNAYFFLNSNDEYELYVNDQFIQTIDDVSHESFSTLPIYKKKDDIKSDNN